MENKVDIHKLYELKEKGIISEKEYQALITRSGLSDNKPKPVKTENLPFYVYFLHCISDKYSTYEGRARRKEFFGFFTGYFFIECLLYLIFILLLDYSPLYDIVRYALDLYLFLPSLCVSIRRLHDANFSGWWLLVPILPIILFLIKSKQTPNKYGDVPAGVFYKTKI